MFAPYTVEVNGTEVPCATYSACLRVLHNARPRIWAVWRDNELVAYCDGGTATVMPTMCVNRKAERALCSMGFGRRAVYCSPHLYVGS